MRYFSMDRGEPRRWIGVAAVAVLLIAAVGRGQSAANPLVGTWILKDAPEGKALVIVINADGTGKLGDTDARYVIDNQHLNVKMGADSIAYTYALEGDTLTISGGDLDTPTAFTRKIKHGIGGKLQAIQTTPAATPPVAPPITPQPLPSPHVAPVSPVAPPPTATPRTGATAANSTMPPIAGKWLNEDGAVFDFREDGTLFFQGSVSSYSTANNVVTILAAGGKIEAPYQLHDNQLVLNLNGQTQVLTRDDGRGASQGSTPTRGSQPVEPTATNAAPNSGAARTAGAIEPAVVDGMIGTWEDNSGARVEFKRDGTLLFSGNSFPYTVKNNIITVTANGQTMQWPYQMKGEKMIVVVSGQAQTLNRVQANGAVEITPTGPVVAAQPKSTPREPHPSQEDHSQATSPQTPSRSSSSNQQ